MKGAYGFEREFYHSTFKALGEDRVISASIMHENMQGVAGETLLAGLTEQDHPVTLKRFRKHGMDLWNRMEDQDVIDFYNIMREDETTFGQLHIAFFGKTSRMQYLVTGDDGTLKDTRTGAPYSTDLDRENLYAMDKYGNLYVMADRSVNDMNINHSSMNAGAQVLCAGMITIANGVLTAIDNMSGHYKPNRTNLVNACEVLRDDCGVDFGAVGVRVMRGEGLEPEIINGGFV